MKKDIYKAFLYQHLIDKGTEVKKVGVDYDDSILLSDIPFKKNSINYCDFKRIIFRKDFQRVIEEGDIPFGITHVVFDRDYIKPLKKGAIPNSVVELTLTGNFSVYDSPKNCFIPPSVKKLTIKCNGTVCAFCPDIHTIPNGLIPNTVKELIIETEVYLRENSIPYGVKVLSIKRLENYLYEGKRVIPNSVVNLTIKNIIIPVKPDYLPQNCIKKITLNYIEKNETLVPGFIPKGVIDIVFGDLFNIDLVIGSIPKSAISVSFGGRFDKILKGGVLSIGLKKIKFGHQFNQKLLPNIIPHTVEDIVFGDMFDKPLGKGVIPRNAKSVVFGNNFSQYLDEGTFPYGLKKLIFGFRYNNEIVKGLIPPTVEYLSFGFNFDKIIEKGVIPESVIYVIFNGLFEQSIEGIFPVNLKYLKFELFKGTIKGGILPPNLTHLILGKTYDEELVPGDLHDSLIYIDFGDSFRNRPQGTIIGPDMENTELPNGIIPSSVIYLSIGNYFSKKINFNTLPNLSHLLIDKSSCEFVLPRGDKNISSYDFYVGVVGNNNFFSTRSDYTAIYYYINNIKIKIENGDIAKFNMYMSNITENDLKGNIILQELSQKVLAPERLMKLSKKYGISFMEILDLY